MKIKLWLGVVACAVLSGCASNNTVTKKTVPHVVNDVVITEPIAVDYKSELAIAKLTQIMGRQELENEQRARLLYDRGVIYDSVGLRSLAQLDFRRALEYKPAYADAYNFIGIHLTLIGQYSQAFDAFDSALEIDPEHAYVYLNRGIALHYYGRKELSVNDLETFYQKDVSDPYRAIWLYLADLDVDPEGARLRLIYNAMQLDKSKWAYQIVELFLGQIEEKEFIHNMMKRVKNSRELADRLCEGYFYLAKLKLAMGDAEAAKNYFRLSLATNVYEFVEHKYARLELNRLYTQDKKRFLEAVSPTTTQ